MREQDMYDTFLAVADLDPGQLDQFNVAMPAGTVDKGKPGLF